MNARGSHTCSADTPPLQRLATSRFHNATAIKRSGLAAIGIVQKPPSWPLGYRLVANVRELAPPYWMWGTEPDEFVDAYRQQLDRLGVDRVTDLLATPVKKSGQPAALLLCYEDVTKGELCHRRVLAEWWEDMVSAEVPEL